MYLQIICQSTLMMQVTHVKNQSQGNLYKW